MRTLQSLKFAATCSALGTVLAVSSLLSAQPAHAFLLWNWSFGGIDGMSQQGTFTTNDGDIHNPNTVYTLTDFSVTKSDAGIYPTGAPIGSFSDGTYGPSFPGEDTAGRSFQFINNAYDFTSVNVDVFSQPGQSTDAYRYIFAQTGAPGGFLFFYPADGGPYQCCINSVVSGGPTSEPIPEPLTILGTGIAFGFTGLCKKEYDKKKKKQKVIT